MNDFLLTATGAILTPDLVQVRRALGLAFDAGEFFEVRALPSKTSRFCCRDDLDAAVLSVSTLSDSKAIHFSVNPIRADLVHAAKAADVACRRWLLIDVDPERPDRDMPATDGEKAHAATLSNLVADWLTDRGWPAPVVYDSGNGYHLRYRIDLPSDEITRQLVRRILKALAIQFDTAGATIGTGVSSAAQLDRLPGTWNCKGPHTPARPHRMATIVAEPAVLEVVSAELLEKVGGPAHPPQTVPAALGGPDPEPVATDGFTLTVQGNERAARYVESVRDQEFARLALSPEGERNHTLNRAAFALGQFIGSDYLDRVRVEDDLLKLAGRIGLDEREARPTIESGIEAGIAQPRKIPVPNATETGDEWPEPFLDSQPPAAPFPLEVLPESLRELCTACEEGYDCPVDFFAVPAVVLAGSAIGMSVNLRMSSTYRVQPHLYGVIVAAPGSKKSPALELMSQPLKEIDRELHEEYLNALAMGLPDDPKPLQKHFILDDFTREVAGLIHSENPRGLVVLKDELVGWVKSLNAYRGGRGADEEFWLTVNTGGWIKVNRKGNNRETQIIPRTCITVIGGLTPANLGVIRASDRDDGWVDRILFSFPDLPEGDDEWPSVEVPGDLLGEWRDAIQYLWNRQSCGGEGQQYPHLIHLEDSAWEIWKGWYHDHRKESKAVEFPSELKGPWAKFEGFTARFALILSQLHQAYSGEPGAPTDVDGLVMHHATLLARYFKRHFERALHGVRRRQIPGAARLLIPRLVQEGKKEFRVSSLTRNYGHCFRGPDDLDETLTWLEKHNFIRPKAHPLVPTATRRGRPSSAVFELNPRLFADNADLADRLSRMRD